MADEREEVDQDTDSSFTEEKDNNSTSTKLEKLAKANALKDEGNGFYKQKDYKNAMKKYHRALLYVKGLNVQHPFSALLNLDGGNSKMNEELVEQIKKTEFSCYNNLAACHIATSRWAKVVDYSSKVLEHQPNNAKALYRRGQAYMHLKDIDRAREDLSKANQLEPKDSGIKRTLALLNKEFQKATEKEKKTYTAMFEKMSV